MRNKYTVIIIIVISAFGCKSKKIAKQVPINNEILENYWQSQFEGDYVEARGKATVNMDGRTNTVAMHLKMKMDSIIWGKFSMFGIGATVLITEDSFFMVNTLSQEYMAYDNSYLSQYLGFKATISQVQNLLLGNAIFEKAKYKFEVDKKQLSGVEGYATNILAINQNNRTYSSNITTTDTSQKADIQYDEYTGLNQKLVPTLVNMYVKKGVRNLDVVLNYQNLNTNPITTFPFKVPNGYIRR